MYKILKNIIEMDDYSVQNLSNQPPEPFEWNTVEGTELNVSDCIGGKGKIEVKGNTEQKQLSGEQPSPSPDYPQEIKVVTGNNVIKHVGKNYFDNVLESGSYNDNTGAKQSGNTLRNANPINIKPNTTYIFSINGIGKAINVFAYKKDMTYIGRISGSSIPAGVSFTTPSDAKYINIFRGSSDGSEKWQIEEGSTATTYEPHRKEEYELSLGNIELCKIGDYEDEPFKNVVGDENYNAELEVGAWYKKKIINKRILDESENWAIWEGVFLLTIINDYKDRENTPICDYYKGIANVQGTANMTTNNTIAFNLNHSGLPRFFVKDERYSTVEDFKNWLSTHNIELYYVLATPTYEKITDQTLISQLEALRKAKWFKGVNHIWTETENIELVLEGTYRQAINE